MVVLWLLLIFNNQNNTGYPQAPYQIFVNEADCIQTATSLQSGGNPTVTWAGCAELQVAGVPANPPPTPAPTPSPTPTASPT
jgi:hypothetical protein